MDRQPAFAGSFYPSDKKQLSQMIEGFFSKAKKIPEKEKTNCIVAPHAGYYYSGQTAAFAYSALKKTKTIIILSPNHTGFGKEISIWPGGAWQTPIGKAKINKGIGKKIAGALGIGNDCEAHLQEHSIEVQLPFLQKLFGSKFDFVAITIATHNLGKLKALGKAIAKAAKGKDVAVIASSDLTHFEPEERAKNKDLAAIKYIENQDIDGFYGAVVSKELSICGFAGIIAAMSYYYYCHGTGKKNARLLHYDSSATANQDATSVVGYAAIGFY